MRHFFTFLLATIAFTSFAQPPGGMPAGGGPKIGSIDGQVFDSISRKPLEYVQLRVFRQNDSTVVGGIFTDVNGKFVLDQLPLGRFYIVISQSEYKDKHIPNVVLTAEKPLRKLGNISLSSSAREIGEVVVTGQKDVLETGIDKKVYNVGSDISVQGGSVNDILNNVPSVEIDQDGKISLRGDGNVTILIDGRPSSLSGGNGKSLLESIPANSIERIEIVTNPSAKYDPDGTSGIINIVLKKNIKRGINGSINASAATGNAYNGGIALNMRNTHFNLYGNYGYDYRDGYRNNTSYMTQVYGDSVVRFDQFREGRDLNISNTARVGMDIYLKDRNTLSWNVSGNVGDRQRLGDQDNFRYLSLEDTLGYWNRTSDDPNDNHNMDMSLNYNWEFKEEKGTVDWNVYQSLGNGTNQGYYTQTYEIPADTVVLDQRLFNEEQNNITTAAIDVVRLIKKKWRTESGVKLIHRNMTVNTHSDSRTSQSAAYAEDTLAFFNYAYTERIYSAYGIFAGTWKNFKYQAGVRLEQSFQEPNLISKDISYLNKYFNAFPSAHVRYTVAKGVETSLGYSKRINRPSSDNLNPFTSYADPYNLRRGNPALKPEYIHSIDLGIEFVQKKWTLTGSVYQRFTNSVIQRVKEFYADGTSAGTFTNIDNSRSTGGELVFVVKPLPFWRATLSANGNYIVYTDDNPDVNYNREGIVWGGKFNTALDLMKKTLTIQLNGRYNAPSVTAQGRIQPRGAMDFSAEKTFKEGRFAVGTRVSDIFNTQGFRFMVDQPTVHQESEFKWQTRRLYLTLRYKFGRTDFNAPKRTGDPGGAGGGGFDF